LDVLAVQDVAYAEVQVRFKAWPRWRLVTCDDDVNETDGAGPL